ncbi:hypothetical protein [Marinobacterium stanieri]|uniref:hypothetical protein n=1 Tax=Marinobacterium stanieri TaxID=49186 RepID=UPI003A927E2A
MKALELAALSLIIMSSTAVGKEANDLENNGHCFIDQYVIEELSNLSSTDINFDSSDDLIDFTITVPAEVVSFYIPDYINETTFGSSTIKENLSLHFYKPFDREVVKGDFEKYSELPELYKISVDGSEMSWNIAEKISQGFLINGSCSLGYEYVHECLFSLDGSGYSLAYELRQDNFDQKSEIDSFIRNQIGFCSNSLGLK